MHLFGTWATYCFPAVVIFSRFYLPGTPACTLQTSLGLGWAPWRVIYVGVQNRCELALSRDGFFRCCFVCFCF